MASRPDHHDRNGDQASQSTMPTPVAAALGLVVSGVRNARRLPETASRLPIIGVGIAVQKAETIRREYLTFAARGVAFVQKVTGGAMTAGTQAVSLLAERRAAATHAAENAVTSTREKVSSTTGSTERTVEEEAREVAEKARDAVEKATEIRRGTSRPAGRTEPAKKAAKKPAQKAPAKKAAAKKAVAKKAVAKKAPAAPAEEPTREELPDEAVEAGAPGAATEAADQAAQEVADQAPRAAATEGEDISPEDLAIPDIDHLTLASLRARLRQLSVPQLVQLRLYEQAHANRLQVVTMLENRIAKLEAEQDNGSGASSDAAGSSTDNDSAAQEAAEPGMEQAESGADDLGATPRP